MIKLNNYSIAIILLLLTAAVLRFTDMDDHIWQTANNLTTDEATKKNSIWLPNYQADTLETIIPGVSGNASGITYDRDRKTLWVIVNTPTYLIEMDLQFNMLRRIDLKNFRDTEAISYVGNGQYLFTDERDQTIVLAKIDKQTTELDKNELRQIVLNVDGYGNKGFEGVAVNPETNAIYAVRERDPMKVVKVTGFIENADRINIEDFTAMDLSDLYVDDLSGLHFDLHTNHLLFLSDESKLIAEADLNGNSLSYMDLEKGFNGLKRSIPQPEGVAMDDDGHLYVVSEPNLIYRFTKSAPSH